MQCFLCGRPFPVARGRPNLVVVQLAWKTREGFERSVPYHYYHRPCYDRLTRNWKTVRQFPGVAGEIRDRDEPQR